MSRIGRGRELTSSFYDNDREVGNKLRRPLAGLH